MEVAAKLLLVTGLVWSRFVAPTIPMSLVWIFEATDAYALVPDGNVVYCVPV